MAYSAKEETLGRDRFGRDVMERVGAIVLGGGQGTRLYPLTALRAKPAVPILGRYRLVDIPLSQCIHSGIKRMVVLTQFQSASLHRHIHNSYQFDNFSKGYVDILAAEQTIDSGDWYQGTADAVRKQLRHIRDLRADYYLILSGDQLYNMDYRDLMRMHLEKRADLTVATLPVARSAARAFGILKVAGDGRIADFIEKPQKEEDIDAFTTPEATFKKYGLQSKDKPLLASMGVYLFNRDVLEDILENQKDWIDFGKHIIPLSLKVRRAFAYVFSGFWEDIGTVRSYYEVHMQMVGQNPPLELFTPQNLIYTHPRYLPGTILRDASIKDAIICEGCRIEKAAISNSIVGIRSVIRSGVVIERTIVMGADYFEGSMEDTGGDIPIGIGENTHISNAIVDKNARIGKNVVLRGSRDLEDRDNDGWAVRDGIVIVLKNASIPDGTRVE
jgi:glucose-1-phosphate adenylyltransferase